MAAGMTVAGISGREHGSESKRNFPRRISAQFRFSRSVAREAGDGLYIEPRVGQDSGPSASYLRGVMEAH